MRNGKRLRPSPAMVVAVVALVAGLTGGAYAANLITGAQIENGSITGADVKDRSLSGADVRNGSLQAADLSAAAKASLRAGGVAGVGVQGPPGPAGPQGPQGQVAAPGTYSSEDTTPVQPGEQRFEKVFCPVGQHVTGAGFNANGMRVLTSLPDDNRTYDKGGAVLAPAAGQPAEGWHVEVLNDIAYERTFSVWVLCV